MRRRAGRLDEPDLTRARQSITVPGTRCSKIGSLAARRRSFFWFAVLSILPKFILHGSPSAP
jgi:hypothetical protein